MFVYTLNLKSDLEIKYLKDCPAQVQTCAQWSFETWGHHTPSRTLADFVASRQGYLNTDCLPFTLVAFKNQIPVGMCSLAANRGVLPKLTPWLAALYVEPQFRNQGIGQVLEQAICDHAKQMGFTKIYCFTSDLVVINWYQKRSWQMLSKEWLHGHEVAVLVKELFNF